ncbi:hypothetical protein B0W47_16655 (plasmid) [Komagataeibacter nataicola]|uniref:Uncharacterized protein n=1 Tax=Komagataeibacter nataicola TaxID=265960 RepID=A0A9N7CTV0_9PROT|nr:hypothetical protein B0W47_16655 [Komagataeibacter nataicola]PYD66274.1 hypothetical protein CDI09_08995 [Komagataeibacter nataicola]
MNLIRMTMHKDKEYPATVHFIFKLNQVSIFVITSHIKPFTNTKLQNRLLYNFTFMIFNPHVTFPLFAINHRNQVTGLIS